ncbi:MAG: class I SAM-dependent methyltransferase [Alphaproteobacteria bacterium]
MTQAPNDQWNPSLYRQNASFVSANGQQVLALLPANPGSRVLDLGCGEGSLAAIMQESGLQVLGVDASPNMVEATKAKGIEAMVVDATALPFHQEFDAVFSNAVLHWVKPPEKAIEGIYRALKPGGFFVAEFGGKGNVATICDALGAALEKRGVDGTNPWYFPTVEEYTNLLEKQGFVVEQCFLVDRPTPLPSGMAAWLKTFAFAYLKNCSEEMADSVINEVTEYLRPRLCSASGEWTADYVRIRLRAHL